MISLMLHVTAAAILVGPQLLMFLAVTPATWLIDDERLKANIIHVVAGRFGMLAGGALVVLLATGLYQYYTRVPDPIQAEMMDYNFGAIFIIKMTLFTLLIGLLLAHVGIFSRRISRLSVQVMAEPENEEARGALETARLQSFTFSIVVLVTSIAILCLGVALGDESYSYQLRG